MYYSRLFSPFFLTSPLFLSFHVLRLSGCLFLCVLSLCLLVFSFFFCSLSLSFYLVVCSSCCSLLSRFLFFLNCSIFIIIFIVYFIFLTFLFIFVVISLVDSLYVFQSLSPLPNHAFIMFSSFFVSILLFSP